MVSTAKKSGLMFFLFMGITQSPQLTARNLTEPELDKFNSLLGFGSQHPHTASGAAAFCFLLNGKIKRDSYGKATQEGFPLAEVKDPRPKIYPPANPCSCSPEVIASLTTELLGTPRGLAEAINCRHQFLQGLSHCRQQCIHGIDKDLIIFLVSLGLENALKDFLASLSQK